MVADDIYMQRCLELAENGLGRVAPNPMVGAVIVNGNKIIGEGFHGFFGGPHAEVNAINAVKDKELLKTSTLYVNLEPCSHHGKTPPCTEQIVQSGIPRIVIANKDPNPIVAGKGVSVLKDHACEIHTGLLEKEGITLNRRFFTYHTKKRPYIILKWAQSLDGYIDMARSADKSQKPTWITGEALKVIVHKWRSEEMAIMIGTNTAYMDDPQLNIRLWQGQDPIRIVIDNSLRLPETLHLFEGKQVTIVYTTEKKDDKNNIQYVKIDFKNQLIRQILNDLYKRGIQSMIVEGGRMLLETFIHDGFWDEARVLTGNKTFYDGVYAPKCRGKRIVSRIIGQDRLLIYENEKPAFS